MKVSEILIAGGIITIVLAFMHPQFIELRKYHERINIDELVIGAILLIAGVFLR